jgi:glycerol-3-phosphate dehydrogenase (NAD(P)+)
LITTCISPEGRNRTVGEQIGKGKKLQDVLDGMNSVAEGVPTTKAVRELARRYRIEMPITEAVYEVLFEDKDVLQAITELMTRDPNPEREDAGGRFRCAERLLPASRNVPHSGAYGIIRLRAQ